MDSVPIHCLLQLREGILVVDGPTAGHQKYCVRYTSFDPTAEVVSEDKVEPLIELYQRRFVDALSPPVPYLCPGTPEVRRKVRRHRRGSEYI